MLFRQYGFIFGKSSTSYWNECYTVIRALECRMAVLNLEGTNTSDRSKDNLDRINREKTECLEAFMKLKKTAKFATTAAEFLANSNVEENYVKALLAKD